MHRVDRPGQPGALGGHDERTLDQDWIGRHRIEKLPLVDDNGLLKGLITYKDILKKLDMAGRDLDALSLDTVAMFRADAVAAGFTL